MSSLRTRTAPNFDHLPQMTDTRGLTENASNDASQPHLYRLDNTARALVLLSRDPGHDPQLQCPRELYLTFVLDAVTLDGSCHTRMNGAGEWLDQASVADSWGHALWSLGVATSHPPTRVAQMRSHAGFHIAARRRSSNIPAMAFAALGAVEVLRSSPTDRAARALLQDCADVLSTCSNDTDRASIETSSRYGDATMAEAFVVTGKALRDPQMVNRGVRLLSFLLAIHARPRHLWAPPAPLTTPGAPLSDATERSIDMAAFADACAAGYRATSDPRWLAGINLAWHWFLAPSPNRAAALDQPGLDGLNWAGPDLHRGTASVLALLSTAQQAHAVHTQR